MTLDRARLERTLRAFIAADVDYDIHKNYECGEETGEDTYPEIVDAFLSRWEESSGGPTIASAVADAATGLEAKEQAESDTEDLLKLRALEAAGVDNWSGYDHAMAILHGEDS